MIDDQLRDAIEDSIQTRGVKATLDTFVETLEEIAREIMKATAILRNGSPRTEDPPIKGRHRLSVAEILAGINRSRSSSAMGYHIRKSRKAKLTLVERNAVREAKEKRIAKGWR